MKKIWKLMLLAMLVKSSSFAQVNLVPNPSFEDTVKCPNNAGEILKAFGWSSPTLGSPDYYNSCSSNYFASVPNNWYGVEQPHTGDAYIGVYTFQGIFGNYREYIQIELKDSLKQNKKYLVQYYVSLSDTSMYSCNSIGVFLSDTLISFPFSQYNLPIIPSVENDSNNFIGNKVGWDLVTDTFNASGGEKYLIIGNFKTDSLSSYTNVGGSSFIYAYYYIDDVSLVLIDSVTFIENLAETGLEVHPNPFSSYINIEFSGKRELTFTLSDLMGRIIRKEILQGEEGIKLDLASISKGCYFLEIYDARKRKSLSKKIIKT